MTTYRDWSITASANTGASADGFFRENMAYSDVNDAAREFQAILARDRADKNGSLLAGGSTGSYVLSVASNISGYRDGDYYRFRANVKNAGPVTVQVSTLSARPVVKTDLSALSAGDIVAGGIYEIFYRSDSAKFQISNPSISYSIADVRRWGADPTGSATCTTAITNALNAYGRAEFYDGTYLTDKVYLSDGGSYRLIGQNATLKLKDAADSNLIENASDTYCNYVEIRGLTLDGNGDNQSAYQASVVSLHVKEARVTGNTFVNGMGTNLLFKHVAEFADVGGNIFKTGIEHTGVLNENPIYIACQTSQSRSLSTVQQIHIHDNWLYGITPTVKGRGVGGIFASGYRTSSADTTHRLSITNNSIYECGQDAPTGSGNAVASIVLYRRGGRSIISGNRIYGGGENGIDIQGSDNVIVSGNLVDGVTGDGVVVATRDGNKTCANVNIEGNVISNVNVGIRPRFADTLEGRDITIANNNIRTVNQAIQVRHVDGNLIITGNNIEDVNNAALSAIGDRALDVNSCDGQVLIANNAILDSANRAISVANSGAQVRIANNIADTIVDPSTFVFQDNTGDIVVTGNMMKTHHALAMTFASCSGRLVVSLNLATATASVAASGGSAFAINASNTWN